MGFPQKSRFCVTPIGGGGRGADHHHTSFFFFVPGKICNNGASRPQAGTVPTLAERGMGTANPGAYDFSASGLPTIYDPTTGVVGSRTAFPGNIIPAGRIDPVALKI